jgi:uncharacterized protein (TIGR00730 family)
VSERGQIPRAIAVFGGSEAAAGTADYQNAVEVGRLIASAGWAVVNGGYGGVMEASARGARDAGGRTLGVTTRAFSGRGGPNPYIDTELPEADLHDRTRRLIESASAFIILPGKSGTLAELSFLWALRRAGLLGPKPIVLLGTIWAELLRTLRGLNLVGEPELAVTRIALSPSEAVNSILASFQGVR